MARSAEVAVHISHSIATMALVHSVIVGVSRANPWKGTGTTGIDKRPVSGPVAVRAPGPKGTGAVGLQGDRAHDVEHHGGDYQAVYAYPRESLDAWAERLGRPLTDGVFGENLTTSSLDVHGALIGEQWRIGPDVLLEVSCPRIPCGTFQGWMSEQGWIRTFTQAAEPGAYLRVIEPGAITAGDEITVTHHPEHDVSVATCFRALTTHSELLPHLLHPGVAEAMPPADLAQIRRRLAR